MSCHHCVYRLVARLLLALCPHFFTDVPAVLFLNSLLFLSVLQCFHLIFCIAVLRRSLILIFVSFVAYWVGFLLLLRLLLWCLHCCCGYPISVGAPMQAAIRDMLARASYDPPSPRQSLKLQTSLGPRK